MTSTTASTEEPTSDEEASSELISPRVEWVVAAVLIVVGVAVTAYMARDSWFQSDDWEYLANRSIGDPGSYFPPYGGHWTTWSTLLTDGLHRVFGLDFWPWYYVPRLIGHTALMVLVWRVARSRGADALLALVTFASLVVLAASSYQRALQVGNWAVYAGLIVAAVIIARHDRPGLRENLFVAAALLVGVLGNGYAAAMLGGVTFSLIVGGRIRRWWVGIVPPLLAYGTWYLVYRDDIQPKPHLTVEKLLLIPESAVRIVSHAIATTTGLPLALAVVAMFGLVVFLAVLARRGQLDVFDLIILSTLCLGLALLTVQRVAEHPDAADRDKYGYSVVVLLVLLFLPHVRLPRHRWVPPVIVVVGLVVLAVNLVRLDDGLDASNIVGRHTQAVVEAAAVMIEDDEPVAVAGTEIVLRLDAVELSRLISQGFSPEPDLSRFSPGVIAEARGALRMNVRDRTRRTLDPGEPPTASVALDGDCAAVEPDVPLILRVERAAVIEVESPRTEEVRLIWTDEFGRGARVLKSSEFARTQVILAQPPPGGAELEVRAGGRGPVQVCGLAPAADSS